MTSDDLDLAAALRDLAARVPDDPTRLASVHLRYRRQKRRRRAVGASALVATMAAGLVGAEALASPGHRVTVATAGVSNLPACAAPPLEKSPTSAPPTTGQSFTGGGMIVALGPSTITVDDLGSPLTGKVTLTITPATKLFRASPQPKLADQATTIDQLSVGDTVKFTAVRTSATTNTLVELHAGAPMDASPAGAKQAAAADASAGGAKRAAAADEKPAPPPVGGSFKAQGTVTAYSSGSLTVKVTGGNLTGTISFTIGCTPALPIVGHTVNIAGTRTGTNTYDATLFTLANP
jgi:hypothetical protein